MNKQYFLFLPLLALLVACDDDTALATIDQLTVEAFLHADQSLDSVHFSKVIPFDSLEAESPPTDLQPVIIVDDSLSYSLPYTGMEGVYGDSTFVIEEGRTYRLEVDYKGTVVSAETYIPAAPVGLELSNDTIYRTRIDDFTDIQNQNISDPIELSWDGEPGAYYFVTVTNIEDNPVQINALFGEIDRPPFPELLTEPSADAYYSIDTFRELTYFGTYEVTVYRVNPEYVALYEDNTGSTGTLNEIRTNVENGFGIFTGVNSSTITFEVRQQ